MRTTEHTVPLLSGNLSARVTSSASIVSLASASETAMASHFTQNLHMDARALKTAFSWNDAFTWMCWKRPQVKRWLVYKSVFCVVLSCWKLSYLSLQTNFFQGEQTISPETLTKDNSVVVSATEVCVTHLHYFKVTPFNCIQQLQIYRDAGYILPLEIPSPSLSSFLQFFLI